MSNEYDWFNSIIKQPISHLPASTVEFGAVGRELDLGDPALLPLEHAHHGPRWLGVQRNCQQSP